MPAHIQKKKALQRTQNINDHETVFDYQHGDINAYVVPEEVELTKELFTEYKNSRELWGVKFQEAVEFRAGAQWTNEEQEVLESRGQAPIVVNRIHPIVETAKSLLTYNSPQFRSTAMKIQIEGLQKYFLIYFSIYGNILVEMKN